MADETLDDSPRFANTKTSTDNWGVSENPRVQASY